MHISVYSREESINQIFLVRKENIDSPYKIIDTGYCDIKGDLSKFFKRCEERLNTKEARIEELAEYDNSKPFNQFAVMHDGAITPIIWFSIEADGVTYSHDKAFSTTLIKKNNLRIPFGRFFRRKNRGKYRYLTTTKAAYRYLSNQLKQL